MIAALARRAVARAEAEASLTARWGAATRGSIENPSTPLSGSVLAAYWGGAPTTAGPVVSESSALTLTAVYACVRILAGALAMLPLRVYERVPRGTRLDKYPAEDHAAYGLLHDAPNADMTSFVWRETTQGHLCLRGNGYGLIRRDNAGRPRAIEQLVPWQVAPERVNGRLFYRIDGAAVSADEVLHVPGFGWDGTRGYSPITLARQSLGLSLAAEEFGARFFANGSNPGGVIQVPQKLSDDGYDRIAASWEQAHAGLANAHKVAILEQGAAWVKTGIDPKDSQFLETRRFQVDEVARIFGIPPHMIGAVDKTTSWGTGIEQQGIGFVTYTLGPWIARWEAELNRKLFSPAERRRYFVKFNVDALLRGDIATRFKAYATGIQWGWLTPNKVLEKEDENGYDGGDDHLRPVNMAGVESGEAADDAAAPAPTAGSDGGME